MKILVVNIDSTIKNLALQKIVMYHKGKGHRVRQINDDLPYSLLKESYDKVYVSCIFSWNKERCKKWEDIADIGGSGYSLTKELPPEIDAMKPKINMGFATRGCIRQCYFCIVPKKEGKIRKAEDVYDIWDGKAKDIIFLDNNILALPAVFFKICKQLKKEGLGVDFNQGLDHRLLTDKICKQLFSLRYGGHSGGKIRFAFDDVSYERTVLKALNMLKNHGMKDWNTRWYVYVGVKDTIDTVLQRVNIIRDWKQAAFVMRDRDPIVRNNKDFDKIYSWSTNIWAYASTTFPEFNQDYAKNTLKSRQDYFLPD